MAKKTALDKAIENIDANINVLQLARAKLVEQQLQAKPARVKKTRPLVGPPREVEKAG